jgi:hypothetical protein
MSAVGGDNGGGAGGEEVTRWVLATDCKRKIEVRWWESDVSSVEMGIWIVGRRDPERMELQRGGEQI